MGYEWDLHLDGVKIKPDAVPAVKKALASPGIRGTVRIKYFLEQAMIDSTGFLLFKGREDGFNSYVPDEDDGTVPAIAGKWYEVGHIARWLRRHSEKGGRLVLHSNEGDGEAWGWEFDGKGRMRSLQLVPVGRWE